MFKSLLEWLSGLFSSKKTKLPEQEVQKDSVPVTEPLPDPIWAESEPFDPQLTANFNIKEFNSPDDTVISEELLPNVSCLAKNLQTLRDSVGKPITVLSGCRSVKVNKTFGGPTDSPHITGEAADITAQGFSPLKLTIRIQHLLASGQMVGSVVTYPTYTHYSVRCI